MKECEFMSEKFNQLIELFIAEEEDKAKELFHEIVVEKSREIYEGLIDEEDLENIQTEEADEDAKAVEEGEVEEELGGDAADDLIDDITADEEGLRLEGDDDDGDIEDRVVDLEDALDELKAEFDEIMGGGEGDEAEMDMDMEVEPEMDDEMDMDMEMGDEEEMESIDPSVMEGADLEKAPAPVTSEDGSVNTAPMKFDNPSAPEGGDASNIAQGGDEKGAPAPKAQDMGMTTEPNETKVSV